MDEVLKRLGEALAEVLVPEQRAHLEREDEAISLNLDNTRTLRGVKIGPCPGCESCVGDGVRHLQFTPYSMTPNT